MPAPNLARIVAAIALPVLTSALAGCVTQQSMIEHQEQMLAAAGFLEKPANTPHRQARLAALPPFRVLSQRVTANGQDTVGYVFADPQFCNCVFVGDPVAFSHYQQLAFQEHLAQEQMAAAQMANDDMFGWNEWGPYDYWGGGVVVIGGGGGPHGGGGWGPHR